MGLPMFLVTAGRVTGRMQAFEVEMLSPGLAFRQEKMPVDFLVTVSH